MKTKISEKDKIRIQINNKTDTTCLVFSFIFLISAIIFIENHILYLLGCVYFLLLTIIPYRKINKILEKYE